MNARELAEKICSAILPPSGTEIYISKRKWLEALLTEAFKKQEEEFYFQRKIEFEASINEAIIEERNECAKVCEDWNCGSNVTKKVNLTLVAAQIRSRSKR